MDPSTPWECVVSATTPFLNVVPTATHVPISHLSQLQGGVAISPPIFDTWFRVVWYVPCSEWSSFYKGWKLCEAATVRIKPKLRYWLHCGRVIVSSNGFTARASEVAPCCLRGKFKAVEGRKWNIIAWLQLRCIIREAREGQWSVNKACCATIFMLPDLMYSKSKILQL